MTNIINTTCSCSIASPKQCAICKGKIYEYEKSNIVPNLESFHFPNTVTTLNLENEKEYAPTIQYWCPRCDALLDKYDNYCHNCGCKLDITKY